jgi:hypothetical protein
VAGALFAASAPTASALVVHTRNGHFFGVELHRGLRASAVPGSIAAQQLSARPRDNGILTYHGGPVVHSSAPYLIFWVPGVETIPASSQALMERYFTDVAADSGKIDDGYGVGRQYTDATGFAGAGQTFDPKAQVLVDTEPYPPTDTANCPGTTYPTCITDAQLQQELERLVRADGLPTDGPASATELPQRAPIYLIVLPGDVNVATPDWAAPPPPSARTTHRSRTGTATRCCMPRCRCCPRAATRRAARPTATPPFRNPTRIRPTS